MSETILVADDSLMVREAAVAALESRGARLETVQDGEEALAVLRERAPGLLVADVHLPGVDGYELCRAARELRSNVPVVLLVGTFEPFDEKAARDAGVTAVLRKPFAAGDLRERVESLLGPAPGGGGQEEQVPTRAPEPAPAAEAAAPAPPDAAGDRVEELSDATVDRIARRVLTLGGTEILERVAREVFGEAAARLAREREEGASRSGNDRSPDR